MESSHTDIDRSPQTWAVCRQDDNGNRFVVETGLTQAEAERLAALYEARGHKQLYWVQAEREPDRSSGAGRQ